MKELIIKTNNWIDKVKEPFRFLLIMITIGLTSLLITTNPSLENSIIFFIIMLVITIWRVVGLSLKR